MAQTSVDDNLSIDTKTDNIQDHISHGPSWNKHLKNGNWVLETSSGLINYNDNGVWKPINIQLRNDNRYLVVDEAPYILKIAPDKSHYTIYPDRDNLDKWITISMPSISVMTSTDIGQMSKIPFYQSLPSLSAESNSLSWNFRNFDINIIPTNSMVSFEYVLKNPRASDTISMKVEPHNCIIAPNGFIDGGRYQLINQVFDDSQIGNITTTYNTETHMLDIEVNTTNLEYPITLDPTISITSAEYGGYIHKSAPTWTEVHDATTGTSVWNKYVFTRIGHIVNTIYRGYMFFDTRAINPSVSSFVSGNISIYGESDTSSGLIDIILQHNKTGAHPSSHLPLTDYNYRYYNDSNLGSLPTAGYVVDGWNYIQLNTAGLENISRTGYTKYCIRSSLDISNTSGGARFIDYYNCRSYFPPVLTLVWNGPEITNEYPVNESTDIPLTMNNHSITVNDSTGLNMDIQWFWRPNIYCPWFLFGTNSSATNGTYYQGNSVNYTIYNYEYSWRICINNSDGVWTNQTYIFHTTNSSAPIISNMSPANRTVSFHDDKITLSAQFNDTDNTRPLLFYWYIVVNNCDEYFLGMGSGYNCTDYRTFYLSDYLDGPGTVQWFIKVVELSGTHLDNEVFSDVYWLTYGDVWSDHFCGKTVSDINHYFNLINTTSQSSYISPVRDSSSHPVLFDDPSFIEFQQYMNNTPSGGIDSSQSTVMTGSVSIGSSSGPRIAFINETIGYATTIVYNWGSGNNRLYIRKTIDGGTTWTTSAVTSHLKNIYYVGMWYDDWTSGNYENKIHIAVIRHVVPMSGVTECQLHYGYFDTETETLTIDYDTVIHTFHHLTHVTDGRPSITVSTDGTIIISAWGGQTNYDQYEYHGVVFRSNDSADTWTDITPSEAFWGVPYGYFRYLFDSRTNCVLLPHGQNDISLIYRGVFGIYNTVYNSTTDSWSTIVSVASTGFSTGYLSATYWKKTGDIYITWQKTMRSASGEINFKKYTLENETWHSEKIIESNVYGYDATIVISEGNGDLYIFYSNSSTNSDSYTNISCVNSTDHGATWGASQRLNSDAPSYASYTYGNLMSEHRIFGSWYDYAWDYQRSRSIRECTETTSYGNTGNLTSVGITFPDHEYSLCRFNAVYTKRATGITFSILNKTGVTLIDSLDGKNNDISSIDTSNEDNRTIYLFVSFTNSTRLDSWNISFFYMDTTVNIIVPWNVNTYPLMIVASGSSILDNVTLWYRYSPDNVTWGSNTSFKTSTSYPWEYKFNFTNGSGYYQFYSIGKTSQCGNITEFPPSTADTWCYFNWDIFLQDISDTTIGKWTTGLLTSAIGGLCCMFGSLMFISCKSNKRRNMFCNFTKNR